MTNSGVVDIHVWSIGFTLLLAASAICKGFLPTLLLLAYAITFVRPHEGQPKILLILALVFSGLQLVGFAAINIAQSSSTHARAVLYGDADHRVWLEGFGIYEASDEQVGVCIQTTLPNLLLFLYGIVMRSRITRQRRASASVISRGGAKHVGFSGGSGGGGVGAVPSLRIGGQNRAKTAFSLHVFTHSVSIIVFLLVVLAGSAIIAPTYTSAPLAFAFIVQLVSLTAVRGRRAVRYLWARRSLRVVPTAVVAYSMCWWLVVAAVQNSMATNWVLKGVNLAGTGLYAIDKIDDSNRVAMRYLQAFLIVVASCVAHIVVLGTKATDATYSFDAIPDFDAPAKVEDEEEAFGATYMPASARKTARSHVIASSEQTPRGGTLFRILSRGRFNKTTGGGGGGGAAGGGSEPISSRREAPAEHGVAIDAATAASKVSKSNNRIPATAKQIWVFVGKARLLIQSFVTFAGKALIHYFLYVPTLSLICVAANIIVFPSACTVPMLAVLWVGLLVHPRRFAALIPFISAMKGALVMAQFFVLATDTWAPADLMRAFFHTEVHWLRVLEISSNLTIFSIMCATSFQHIVAQEEVNRQQVAHQAVANRVSALSGHRQRSSLLDGEGAVVRGSNHWSLILGPDRDRERVPPSHISASRKLRVISKLTVKRVESILQRMREVYGTRERSETREQPFPSASNRSTTLPSAVATDNGSAFEGSPSAAAASALAATPDGAAVASPTMAAPREGGSLVYSDERTSINVRLSSRPNSEEVRRVGDALTAAEKAALLADFDVDLVATFEMMVGRKPYEREVALLLRYFRRSNGNVNNAPRPEADPLLSSTGGTAATTKKGSPVTPLGLITVKKWELLLWFYYNSKQSVWSQLAVLIRFMAVQYAIPIALVSVFVMSTFVRVLDVLHGIALVQFLLFICFNRFAAKYWHLVAFTTFSLTAFYVVLSFVAPFTTIPTYIAAGIKSSTVGINPLETQWHAVPYFIASFAVAAVFSLSREEITTPSDLIAAFDWGRFLRKPLVIAWQRRVTMVAVTAVFSSLAIAQASSLLVEGLLVVLLVISVLGVYPQFPRGLQRWVWIVTVIYSAFAVVLVSAMQFADIKARVHELFAGYSLCAGNDACERDLGVIPSGSMFVLTLFLAPWCVALVTSFIHLTSTVEVRDDKGVHTRTWFSVMEERGRDDADSAADEEEEETSMETRDTPPNMSNLTAPLTTDAPPTAAAAGDGEKAKPPPTATLPPPLPRKEEDEDQQDKQSSDGGGSMKASLDSRTAAAFDSPDQRVVHAMYTALLFLEKVSRVVLDVCGDYSGFFVWGALYFTSVWDTNLANLVYAIFFILDLKSVLVLLYCILHILVIYSYGLVFVPTITAKAGDSTLAAVIGIETRIESHYAIIAPLLVFYTMLLRRATSGRSDRRVFWDRRPIERLTHWLVFLRTAMFDVCGYELFIFASLGTLVYASDQIVGVVCAAMIGIVVYLGRFKFLTSRLARFMPFLMLVTIFFFQIAANLNRQHGIWRESDVGEWWPYLRLTGTTQVHVGAFFCIVIMHLANDWQLCSVKRYQRLFTQHGPNRATLPIHLALQGVKSLTEVPSNEFDLIIPASHEETSRCCMAIVNQFMANLFYLFSPFAVASFVAGVDSPTILNLLLVVFGLIQLLLRRDLFWEFNWVWPRIYVPYYIVLIAFPLIGSPTIVSNWVADHPTLTDVVGLSYNGVVQRLSWGKAVALFVAILQRRVFEEFGFETVLRRMQYQYDVETEKHEALMRRFAEVDERELAEADKMRRRLAAQLEKIQDHTHRRQGGAAEGDESSEEEEEGEEVIADEKKKKNTADNDDPIAPFRKDDGSVSPRKRASELKRRHKAGLNATQLLLPIPLSDDDNDDDAVKGKQRGCSANSRTVRGPSNEDALAMTVASKGPASPLEPALRREKRDTEARALAVKLQMVPDEEERRRRNLITIEETARQKLVRHEAASFLGAEQMETFFETQRSMGEMGVGEEEAMAEAEQTLRGQESWSDVDIDAYLEVAEGGEEEEADREASPNANDLGLKDRAVEGTKGFAVGLIYRIHASSLAGKEDDRWATSPIVIRLLIALVTFAERYMSDFVLIFVVTNFLASGSVWDAIPCFVLFVFAAPWYPVAPASVYDFVAVFLLAGVIIKTAVPLITAHVTFGPALSKFISTVFVRVPQSESGESIRTTVSTSDVALDFVVFALILAHQAICSHNGAHAPRRRYAQIAKERREEAERKRREELFPTIVSHSPTDVGEEGRQVVFADEEPVSRLSQPSPTNGRGEEGEALVKTSLRHSLGVGAKQAAVSQRYASSFGAASMRESEGWGSSSWMGSTQRGRGAGDSFIVRYINNILQQHGMGWDLYSLMFAMDLASIIVFTLTYYFIQGSASGSIITSVQNNLLPGPYVLVLFILILLMVFDRVCFITRSLMAKWALTVAQSLCLMIGYVSWIHTVEPVRQVMGMFFFLFKLGYVFVSCLQMRRGYAIERRHDPFTHDHEGILLWLGYQAYRAVPFLWELRVTIDWACETTSLRFAWYLLVEDMYDIIYNRHVSIADTEVQQKKFGDPITRGRKVIDGCTRIAVMIFVIVFPLFYYSSFNPATMGNAVTSSTVGISFGEGSTIFESSVASVNGYPGTLGKWLQNTRPGLKDRGASDPQKASQLISLTSCSNELWGVSPQALRRMNDTLLASIANTTGAAAEMHIKLQVQRLGSLSETVSTSEQLLSTYTLPFESSLLLYEAINDKDAAKTVTVKLPKFYRPIILNQPSNVMPYADGPGDWMDCTMQLRSEYDMNMETIVRYWCLKCNSLFTFSNFPNASFPEWRCLVDGVGCDRFNFEARETQYTPVSMYFAVISDRIPESISFLPNIGIIALYTTFVLAVGRVFRAMVAGSAQQAIYQYMHDPKPVDDLVRYIFVARAFGDLMLEQSLYYELLDLLRSPETLLAITGAFPKRYIKNAGVKTKGD